MPSLNQMTPYVDAWTVQVVMASNWLSRLYRTLGDTKQAVIASQAGEPGLKRMNLMGLQGQLAPLEARFNLEHPEETIAEEAAWKGLVEAVAGLAAFYAITAMTEEEKPTPGLRGVRTATYKAFRKSIRGFRTAFPAAMVEEGVTSSIRRATATCVDALLANMVEEDPKKLAQLHDGLEACVFEALEKLVAEA